MFARLLLLTSVILIILPACSGEAAGAGFSVESRSGSASVEPLPDDRRTSNAFSITDTVTIPEPIVFAPGVISTSDEEWRITFMPDGNRAYFARSEGFFPITRQATIYETRLEDGRWTAPVVAPFSGTYPDIDPFVSPDGSRLFFSSIRPVDGRPRDDIDIWYVERMGDGWSEPRHAGAVNSGADELYASVTDDGTLYVASDREGGHGGWDIYRATPDGDGYGPAENLGPPVNTPEWDFNPAISPDGTLLVFTGLNYEGGAGLGDLYMSRLIGDEWQAPVGVGALVNTPADEYHASFSPDGRLLFFVRRDEVGDIYVVSWPH